jgi:phosphoenolpyruvate carboxykinase (GTP)
MIRPPKAFNDWKIRTVGDDIAWIHCSDEGSTVGINPEHGFFGVAYDTGPYSNPNILECIKKNTLFTNVGLTTDNKPWWEGLTEEVPKNVIDWTGKRWASNSKAPVANKNSRYATKIDQYSLKSKNYNLPDGVPISIILFGGRRANLVPLVYEAYNWEHGILIGAMMRAETTTAISGKVGQLRHDPMGMMDFCGYNMGDYFAHWIEFGKKLKTKPRIFFVNWFRKDGLGNYLWPGFSENFRILKWMVDRVENGIDAVSTPIGYIPKVDSIDLTGLDIKKETVEELLKIDKDGWLKELSEIKEFFYEFDGKIPNELWNEYYKLEKRLIESQ